MKTTFSRNFTKQITRLRSKKLVKSIIGIIEQVEEAASVEDIHNLKKLKGSNTAYRIRAGSYRIGVFIDDDTVDFDAFAHRQNIYKLFP